MKKKILLFLVVFLAGMLWVQVSLAQDPVRWNLPQGALARLGKGRLSETDRTVAYSPDGTRLAVASSAGIWMYDAHTGAEIALLKGGRSVSFSPDGGTLAVGGEDIRLWDVESGQEKSILSGGSHLLGSYSPDGHTLASYGWGKIQLWDVESGRVKSTLDVDYVTSVSFSPDGNTLASGDLDLDNAVRLWDVGSGREEAALMGHSDLVTSVSFSPDGRTLASGSEDRTIRLWDVDSGQEMATLKGHGSDVLSVSFSPDGSTLASGSGDHTVRLWDVEGRQEMATLQGHPKHVHSVAWSPDGRTLASTDSWDNTVRLWDVDSGQVKAILGGSILRGDSRFYVWEVWAVAFSPDGSTLASVGWGNWHLVRLWDVDSGGEAATLIRDPGASTIVHIVSFAPDGRTLATGGCCEVRFWDMPSGKGRVILNQGTPSGSFSPDGNTWATTGPIQLWDVDSGQAKATLEGGGGVWPVVTWSPDGKTLASGDRHGDHDGDYHTVLLWDVDGLRVRDTLSDHGEGVTSLSFSADGSTLASGSEDGTIRLWDVERGGPARAALEGHRSDVSSLSFSPDGSTLASASRWDFAIRLWDVDGGEAKATLDGHTDVVPSVSFSPDGSILASGSRDGTILLWDMAAYVPSTAETAVAAPAAVLPTQTALLANCPNPFNSRTHIGYRLAARGMVRLSIYNVLGKQVRTLVDQVQPAGEHQVAWDGRGGHGELVSSGVYLMRLDHGGGQHTRRLLYLK